MPVPLAVLLFGMCFVFWSWLLKGRIAFAWPPFDVRDLLLIGYVSALGLGLPLSGGIQPKNVNHFLAYTGVVCVYYFFVKLLFAAEGTWVRSELRLRKTLVASVMLVAGYAVLEFVDANTAGIGVRSLVRFPTEAQTYKPLFLGFVRARGFMAESGFLALYLNLLAPMSLVFLWRAAGWLASLSFLALVGAALGVTFSVAGVVFLGVGIVVAVIVYLYDRRIVLTRVRTVVALTLASAALGIVAVATPVQVWTPVIAKLTLASESSSGPRLAAWRDALNSAAEHPVFGTGIGSTAVETGRGVISFYLTTLKEAGIPALVFVLLFLSLVFRTILVLPRSAPYKYAYVASFVAAICHYAVVSDIWYPWLWFLCAFVSAEQRLASVVRARGGADPAL
jgi:O-antigen ligase